MPKPVKKYKLKWSGCMIRDQLEYLERIRQLAELAKDQDTYTSRLITLNAILENIKRIEEV